MTMPHLMNCPHSCDSWCLDCVKELYDDFTVQVSQMREVLKSCEKKLIEKGDPWDGDDYELMQTIREYL